MMLTTSAGILFLGIELSACEGQSQTHLFYNTLVLPLLTRKSYSISSYAILSFSLDCVKDDFEFKIGI